MKSGRLLGMEGTDGSGKKTQADLLVQRLQKEGYDVETISFPQYGQKSAGPVELYLEGRLGSAEEVGAKKASIFYAVDRYVASFKIREMLDAGVNVVADRFVASNMAHQGGKISDPQERMDFFNWNEELEYGIFGLPRPDLNIILHVPAEVSIGLMDTQGRVLDIHESDLDHLRASERTYLEIADNFPGFQVIECVRDGQIASREEIHELVWAHVQPIL